MKKITIFWITLSFVTGLTVGGLGGALFVLAEKMRYETDAIATAFAENVLSVTSPLIVINDKEGAARIDAFEAAARTIVIAGVGSLHVALRFMSDEKKPYIEGVLRGIAKNREKLKIGRFGEPSRDDIEEILNEYADVR